MTATWKLCVVLRSPFLIPGVSAPAVVADAVPAVNAKGQPIIPGSLMRGLFRDAVGTAFGAAERDALFGGKSGKEQNGDYAPRRRALEFSDLVGKGCGNKPQFARVSIDRATGAAKEGHLQFIELAAPPNCLTVFEGTVTCSAPAAKDVEATLEKAKKLIRAVGSHKSSGFGEVTDIILTRKGAANPLAAAKVDTDFRDWVELRFTLNRPFLVDSEHSTGNRFRGAEVIPGAVFKGALASALGTGADEWLAKTHIGHARPAPEGEAPYPVLPFSLALIDGRLIDMFDDKSTTGVPIFETDWKPKDRKAIYQALGMRGEPFIPRDVRVRTAMNYLSGVVAYEIDPETKEGAGQLFSYDAVDPTEHQWVARWWINDDSHADRAAAILRAGLPGIGKTRAVATAVSFTAVNDPALELDKDGGFTLTLLTDAALGLDYAAYWKEQGFELVDYFAKQRLAGGYQALRYPIEKGQYRPYVLTRAGSVFKIKGEAQKAAEWLRQGLPPVASFSERSWKEFPFGRENGFGAVTAQRPLSNNNKG